MQIPVMISGVAPNEWTGGDGVVRHEVILTCLDLSEISPMKDTFDVIVSDAVVKDYEAFFRQQVLCNVTGFEVRRNRLTTYRDSSIATKQPAKK